MDVTDMWDMSLWLNQIPQTLSYSERWICVSSMQWVRNFILDIRIIILKAWQIVLKVTKWKKNPLFYLVLFIFILMGHKSLKSFYQNHIKYWSVYLCVTKNCNYKVLIYMLFQNLSQVHTADFTMIGTFLHSFLLNSEFVLNSWPFLWTI